MTGDRRAVTEAGRSVARWLENLLRPLIIRLRLSARNSAEAEFLETAGSAAPIVWLDGWPGLLGLAAASIVFWFLPDDWLAWVWTEWHAGLHGAWAVALGWSLLPLAAILAELVRTRRSRARLAVAYAAADGRLGGTFLRFPGSLVGAGALLVASRLPGLETAGWLATLLAAQAGAEFATRCLVVPGGRLRLAGRMVARSLRSVATLWLMLFVAGWLLYSPPPPPSPTQDDIALRLQSDPAVAAADRALAKAFAATKADSAAPYDLLRLRSRWQSSHVADGSVAASLQADATILEQLRAFQAFWRAEQDHAYSEADLAGRCVTSPPVAPCRILREPMAIEGSGGLLRYRIAGRGDTPKDTMADSILPAEVMDVFAAGGAETWHHVLRVAYDSSQPPHPPREILSPAGPVLVLPPATRWWMQEGEVESGNQVFLQQGTSWRRVDTVSWVRQATAALPPHRCLLQTTYSITDQPLRTDIEPDYSTLTALGRYGMRAGSTPEDSSLVALRFAIQDQALVLRDVTLAPYSDNRPWWRRWWQQRAGC